MRHTRSQRISKALARSAGFSLIEVSVVLAIIAILASLGIASLMDTTKRASFSSVAGDLITGIRRTQQESTGRGEYTAFIVDTVGNRWWGIQTDASFDLSTFDPANPGNLIVSGTFPSGANKVVFGPAAGYGSTLSKPFDGVPTTSAGSPNLPYCSFCDTGTGMGAILFEPGAEVIKYNGGPNTPGQQFTVQWSYKKMTETLVVAVVTRTGLIETFRN
jgi:prepilin-type N-terminal cleavage/methylation domain-containing protein